MTSPVERRERFPRFLPQWIKKRIAVDAYPLQEFIRRVALEIPSGAFLLDAGAGEGQYKPFFAHTRYVGVDLAVGDPQWDYRDLDTICTLTDLPFESGAFDVVLCTQVLEHVAEPAAVLKEIQRVLKPGGKLLLTAPQSWHQHQKPHDYYRYTSFGLRYLLQKVGLQVETLEPMGGYFWFLAFQLHNVNHWLFPRRMAGRRWTWPLRAFLGLIFELLLPLMLFYLDPLDRQKDETFGHTCVAVKPPPNENPG